VTFAERVAAIAALGFSPRRAAFLATVAVHSGYCLRRQYIAFAECRDGKHVHDFLDGLVDRNLARRISFSANRGIYHLFGRRLYAAIGEEDNRNRRHAGPPQIARRLMFLDFVIAHPGFDWHVTEADITNIFVNRLGVPPEIFPQKTPRTRIQQFSVFLHADAPTIHFVTLVTDAHASAVDTFVRDHTALLCHIRDWALHAVLPRCTATDAACTTAFQRALAAASMTSIPNADLEWFAKTKPLVGSGDLRTLNVEDLTRYRELSKRVASRLQNGSGQLTVHHLPHSYIHLGSLPIPSAGVMPGETS